MRKTALVLSLGAVCVAILSGCKRRTKYVVPTTSHDKVSVALSGVEKSVENIKTSGKTNSSKSRSAKRVGQNDSSGALNEIFKLYNAYDSLGDQIDTLEYDQPPMIQFRCIKNVFDTMGEDFKFDTKYTNTIDGEVYFDPEEGDIKESSQSEFKYDYSFTLSTEIGISSSDLITANLAFKINLTQGQTTLETNWFLSMTLDYDMSKENPTYTLSMYLDNEESALEYLHFGNTYEYDFIDMKDGRINEWRKFCYETNKQMIKNENHPDFESYSNEADFKVQIGASKWYKNADLKKITIPKTSITKQFAGALFDKFGVNSTDINSAAFVSKSGTENETLKTVYQNISNIFEKELIYELISGTEAREEVKSSLKIMDYNAKNSIDTITLNGDINLKTLFNGVEGNYGIFYFDKNDVLLEQAEDFSDVTFRLTIPYGLNDQEKVFYNLSSEKNFSELYQELTKDQYNARHSVAILRISSGKLNAVLSIAVGEGFNQLMVDYYRGFFPEEIINMFPVNFDVVYEGEECLFDYKDDIQTYIDISGTNSTELNAYKAKLENANWSKEVKTNETKFTKISTAKDMLYTITIVENATDLAEGKARILYNVEETNNIAWPQATIKEKSNNIFDLAEPVTQNGYFTTNEELEDTIILKNFSTAEIEAFIDSLEACGAKTVGARINALNVSDGNEIHHFAIAISESEVAFTYVEESAYQVYSLTIEKQGESGGVSIPLNDNYTSYTLQTELHEGVYKVKKSYNAIEEYVSMTGHDQQIYDGVLEYNPETKELTVSEDVTVTFFMDAVDTTFLRIQSGQSNQAK